MKKRLFFVVALLTSMSFGSVTENYSQYQKFLNLYVCDGNVAYNLIDSTQLSLVKSEFSKIDEQYEELSGQQKIAYLINLYNFYTIDLIYSNRTQIKNSIRDIPEPWNKRFIPFLNKTVSLDHIENTVLRKEFSEARIHFALVCASRSCPPIVKNPFIGSTLNAQLDTVAYSFLSDQTRNRVEKSTIFLSKIFEWYGSDFGPDSSYVTYVKQKLSLERDYKISFLSYNWGLNITEKSCP